MDGAQDAEAEVILDAADAVDTDMADTTKPSKDRLVLVVHGIGEQMPGETIDVLVGGLTGDRPCQVVAEKRQLHETKTEWSESCNDAELFPCDIRSVRFGDRRTDFAEVYWGDLSRGFRGSLNGIVGLFTLIMSLSHIARENRHAVDAGPVMSMLSWFFVMLLHGPIVTINLGLGLAVMFLILFNAGFTLLPMVHEPFGGLVPDFALLSTGLAFLFFFYRRRKDRSSHLYTMFLRGLAVTGVALISLVFFSFISAQWLPPAAIETTVRWFEFDQTNQVWSCLVIDGFASSHCRLLWYTETLVLANAASWGLAILAVLLLGLGQVGNDLFDRDFHRNKTLYPATYALILVVWMFMALTVWAGLTEFFSQFQPTATEPSPNSQLEVAKEPAQPGTVVDPNAAPAPLALPEQPAGRVGGAVGSGAESGGTARVTSPELQEHVISLLALPDFLLKKSINEARFAGAAISAAMFLLIATFLIVAGWRFIKLLVHKFLHDEKALKYSPPRVIVSGLARIGLTFCVFLLSGLVALKVSLFFSLPGTPLHEYAIWVEDQLRERLYGLSLFAVAAATFFFTFFRTYISIGFGIAKDVVVWFMRSENQPGMDLEKYPMQQRILNRFNLVYDMMLDAKFAAGERYSEVVVVSHSQGTVIAFAALRKRGLQSSDDRGRYPKLDLVTMGSPITHLYAHYFGANYNPNFGDGRSIRNWTNIYRTDDFVGTQIDPMPVEEENGKKTQWPINVAIPAGGHTNYWTDGDALEHLRHAATPEFPTIRIAKVEETKKLDTSGALPAT